MSGANPIGSAAEGGIEEAVHLLRDGLEATSGADIRLITIPAPAGDPARLLDIAPDEPAFFWTTPGTAVQAGLGAAATLEGAGPGRLDALRGEAEALWSRVEAISMGDVDSPGPRVYGGISFIPGPTTAAWEPFGDARFVLPRILYTRRGDRASLTLAVGHGGDGADPHRVIAEAESALRLVCGDRAAPRVGPGPGDGTGPAPATLIGDGSAARERWQSAVRSIQDRIRGGAAEKIVAARSRSVPLPDPEIAAILRRLDRESSTAARFAFRFGGSVFLGATPERLISRCGRAVRTEALAGSVPAGDPAREARLVESLKDGVEHGYVVRAIVEALRPVCAELERPSEPRVQRLRHVLHLQTPFEGTLAGDVHILELVRRLHPTPAVGGLPTDEALDWIRREEAGSRGWYAGPVGWFDAAGDGEFGVALRSGLLADGRAHLYAGAGIVRDSDPAAEFEETEVKLRTMLDALGALE